jgi:hypothetical protein
MAFTQPEHGRHGALSGRHRLLHEGAARADGARRLGRPERAGGDERRVLAERVAGDEVGHDAVRGQHRRRGRGDGQDGGLGVGGQLELLFRPLEAELRELGIAERGVDLVEDAARRREGIGERLAHPRRLRSLSREDEGQLSHR